MRNRHHATPSCLNGRDVFSAVHQCRRNGCVFTAVAFAVYGNSVPLDASSHGWSGRTSAVGDQATTRSVLAGQDIHKTTPQPS